MAASITGSGVSTRSRTTGCFGVQSVSPARARGAAGVPVADALGHEREERLVFALVGMRQVRDHRVEQGLDAAVLERRAAEDREPRPEALAQIGEAHLDVGADLVDLVDEGDPRHAEAM